MTISRAADKFALRATPSALHLAIYELAVSSASARPKWHAANSRIRLKPLNPFSVKRGPSGKRQAATGKWKLASGK